ncbi:rod shape-determining protein [Desulfofundulus sp. TPOSR]|jgi:rod shape-determining protein MreB|uniref:Cell shape-determining protein MreB n=1 Tax=Desulfofundulus kuznetsovii (strain DSM 6115 / VKM B-1805 / 17) TaxID=760568 RepID=A0AAU8Q240_DESK7|nr:rod shape-determining protein [Desulfofundulus sp. TPOSR]AEG16898.1 cell shape determining protein, MreB/Mrl family [Desulfofundulus kuznetsovii DSM 6115]NHM26875.1 rod shape-determining protein [Desulfofundulus sp. TPOSR]
MLGLNNDIGIDLGTANVLVYVKGKGIVLREPSVVAINKENDRVIAVGSEARRMLGRTPGNIVATRPLRDGVIADYDVTEKMLRYFISRAGGKRGLFRPRVMVCIPSGVTSVEERAVRQAAIQAGARQAYVIEEPLAAALGAGLDISEPTGTMVVDIGGGTTDVAVLSLGGVVCSRSLRLGGDRFDEAIVRYVRRVFNLAIGERSGEEIKINIGSADPGNAPRREMEIRGRDLVSGLPRAVVINTHQVHEAISESLEAVVGAVKEVLEHTPPELAADIVDKGIVLTGGGALLHGIDTLLSRETGVPVHIAEDPLSCVALGTGRALSMLNVLSANSQRKKRLLNLKKIG